MPKIKQPKEKKHKKIYRRKKLYSVNFNPYSASLSSHVS